MAEEIGRIRAPTLVLVGDQDVATVPARAERMRERIANAGLVVLPGAGHSSTLEEPEAFNAVLVQFLDERIRTPFQCWRRCSCSLAKGPRGRGKTTD